jgi:hypothetical protein
MGKLTHPGDLTKLTRDQLDAWHNDIRAAAAELGKKATFDDADRAYSRELIDWAAEVTNEYTRLADTDNSDDDADARAALAALGETTDSADDTAPDGDDEPDDDTGAGDSPEVAVMRSVENILNAVSDRIRSEHTPPDPGGDAGGDGGGAAPSVSDLAGAGAGGDLPEGQPTGPVMVAAADYSGYSTGQTLATRRDLAEAVKARIGNYVSSGGAPTGPVLPAPPGLGAAAVMDQVPGGTFALTRRTVKLSGGHQKHAVARIARDEFGEFGTNPEQNRVLALAAADDWTRQLRAGRSAALGGTARDTLIAAWCAPAESLYDLCEQWSLDGMLPLPTRNVPRGEVQFAQGYDFADVYDMVGNNTADCAQLEAGVTKSCVEVPCLDAPPTCLNADWLCVTANLLQRRAWPESIESFLSAALAVKLHKTNARVIASMVAASTDAGPIAGGDNDDAFASFLSAVEVAITDMSYRAYMSLSGEWEVVAPVWVLPQLRAAVMRRRAIDDPVKADSWMQAQFAKLNATVHFVYGWQDAHVSPLVSGLPGGPTPIAALPTEVDFMVYPAGTWVKGVNPVIELDTIYDSTGLETNSYTALFVEDGWATLQMCPYSRVYTATVDPLGCGCNGTAPNLS